MRHFTAVSTGAIVLLLLSSLALVPVAVVAPPTAGGTVDDAEDGNESAAVEETEGGEMSTRLESAIQSGNANGNVSGGEESGNENSTAMGNRAESQGVENGSSISASNGGSGLFDVKERILEITDALIEAGIEEAKNIISTLVDELNYLLFRLPAPGVPDDPVSWYLPENGWWPDFMRAYGLMSSVAFAVLVPALMLAMIKRDTAESRDRIRFCIKAMGLILVGPLLIGAFLHTFNAVNLALAPSGSEFVDTPGDAAQLGIGATLFLLLLKLNIGIILAGVCFQLGQFILTHVAVAMWPISWAFRAVPVPTFEAIGEFGTNMLPLLVLLNFGQVAILRMLFMVNWSAYGWGAVIAGLLGTAIVLLLTLVVAPYMLAKQQWQAVGVSIGTKQAKQAGSDAVDFASAKIENVRARFEDSSRGSGGNSGGSQPRSTSSRDGGSSSPQAATDGGQTSARDLDRRRRDV